MEEFASNSAPVKNTSSMKTLRIVAWFFLALVLIMLLLAVGCHAYKTYYYIPPDLAWDPEYGPPTHGNVDMEFWASLGKEYELGSNSHGYAVFKDPFAAFKALKHDYPAEITAISQAYGLLPINQFNYPLYGTYGCQTDPGKSLNTALISSFVDLYENSFPPTFP